jgi:hypothetical protein
VAEITATIQDATAEMIWSIIAQVLAEILA